MSTCPDYNRILIDKWKKLTMAQISTLEEERCWLIIHKMVYFKKNQINPALLNKLVVYQLNCNITMTNWKSMTE